MSHLWPQPEHFANDGSSVDKLVEDVTISLYDIWGAGQITKYVIMLLSDSGQKIQMCLKHIPHIANGRARRVMTSEY